MTDLVSPFVLEYAYKRTLGPVLTRFFTALRDGRLQGVATADGRVLLPQETRVEKVAPTT